MGAYATWQICISHPEWVAAAVPVCGGGMYWDAGRLKDIPVWAFHGEKDDVVLCCESQHMTERINLAGGNAKLTLLPGNVAMAVPAEKSLIEISVFLFPACAYHCVFIHCPDGHFENMCFKSA